MRKVILGLAVSLDCLIGGPNGEYDWCFTDQDYGLSDLFKRIDALFIGRKSYELLSTEGNQFGMPPLEEYIFSNTLNEVKRGIIVRGDINAEVEMIKRRKGKDIWLFGGAELTTSLMNLGLVDELLLAVHPVILGKGMPLFNGIKDRVKLKLIDSKTYSTGLISLQYLII